MAWLLLACLLEPSVSSRTSSCYHYLKPTLEKKKCSEWIVGTTMDHRELKNKYSCCYPSHILLSFRPGTSSSSSDKEETLFPRRSAAKISAPSHFERNLPSPPEALSPYEKMKRRCGLLWCWGCGFFFLIRSLHFFAQFSVSQTFRC